MDPDVCGLQEVWAEPEENFAASLAGELGMHWAWAPSPQQGWWRSRIGDPEAGIGNAVLSRWPILEETVLHLPAGDGPDEGRTALFALLDAPGGKIPFFTTQLNSAPHQSSVRRGQVTALARFVADRATTDFPPVVTGDFNAEADSLNCSILGPDATPGTPEFDLYVGQLVTDRGQFGRGEVPGKVLRADRAEIGAIRP